MDGQFRPYSEQQKQSSTCLVKMRKAVAGQGSGRIAHHGCQSLRYRSLLQPLPRRKERQLSLRGRNAYRLKDEIVAHFAPFTYVVIKRSEGSVLKRRTKENAA